MSPTVLENSANSSHTLAEMYQVQHQDYQDDLPFWLHLAAESSGQILELGCGTGRVLLALAEAGYTVMGIDYDPNMLAVLKEHIPTRSEGKIQMILGDFTTLAVKETFHLIILPCNTYSTLSAAARALTLDRVVAHLEPGGYFTVSLPNPVILAELSDPDQPETEMIFSHPQTGNPVQVSSDWETSRGDVKLRWFYDHLLPDGKVERLVTTVTQHKTTRETYQAEIFSVGLDITATYGDFDFAPYHAESPYLIFVTQKI
jgi:SAM-dependent methyltransferase